MVADFHRTMLRGGLFMYPGTVEKPEGKLRLLRWRNGDVEEVTVVLEPIGDYSPTSPYSCEKSEAISGSTTTCTTTRTSPATTRRIAG